MNNNEYNFDLSNGFDLFDSDFNYINRGDTGDFNSSQTLDNDQIHTPNDVETEQFHLSPPDNFLCNDPFATLDTPNPEQNDKILNTIPSPQPTIAKKKKNQTRTLRALNIPKVTNLVRSNKGKSAFSDQNIKLYCLITINHSLECENFPDGLKQQKIYYCCKNRIFWIDVTNKDIDKIHVFLETKDNRFPCLFIDKFDNLNLTIEDFSRAAFTLVYQHSNEFLKKNYPDATFNMKTSEGTRITNQMANTTHTLTITAESEGKIISENKFDFKWAGKNHDSRKSFSQ